MRTRSWRTKDGRFWDFAALLLEQPGSLREPDLVASAARLGLDASQFEAALRDHRYAPRVEADVQAGIRRGLRGSPTMLVNGKRIDGVPSADALARLIDAELAARHAGH